MKLDLISMTTKKEGNLVVHRNEIKLMRAGIDVSYRNCNEDLLLCYNVVISCRNRKLCTMEIIYKILKEDIIKFSDYKCCLNKAVDDLQERIEIIVALFTEEMGYEIDEELN